MVVSSTQWKNTSAHLQVYTVLPRLSSSSCKWLKLQPVLEDFKGSDDALLHFRVLGLVLFLLALGLLKECGCSLRGSLDMTQMVVQELVSP